MKIVIVGGVAGGATVAARLRRLSEEYEIIILERDSYISYANCGLPYYIGDVITDKEKLVVQTPQAMGMRFNLDIRTKHEVLSIDKANKKLLVKNLESGEDYEQSYDKLILSCGAKPLKPPIKGLDRAQNVFTLRNIPDTFAIKEYIQANNVKKAAVIGGGFIGVEMAENLAKLGIEVSLIEKLPQVLRQLDFEMAQFVHAELCGNGIELILSDQVEAFADKGRTIVLGSGRKIACDMAVLAIGIAPDNILAKSAALKLGDFGHLQVSETFNTFDKESGAKEADIYAIGDMIEVVNPLDNSTYAVSLAWGANRQGRLLADHIFGSKIKASKILATNVISVFELTAAGTGANEETLKAKGIPYKAIHAHRSNHASYYPGSFNISLKLLYEEKTGRILGAQAVGRAGTEKRIDTIATAMRFGGTIFELSDLEFCYAPPYSSAKDPVNILGYIGENIEAGAYKPVYHYQIDEIAKNGGYILDVRTPIEYNNGKIEGSINLEVDSLRQNIDKITLSKDAPLYVTCQVGLRAYIAIKILKAHGFTNLYNLSGGYLTYKMYHYQPIVNKKLRHIEVNDLQQKKEVKEIDVTGLQCPGPLMATYKAVEALATGEKVRILATDTGFANDIENWCQTNGHILEGLKTEGGRIVATIAKGDESRGILGAIDQRNATIVVFSGALDKVLAAMIIAQGAAAQGKNVTMFFTFWGLNALRRSEKVKVKKSAMEKMFGTMMPKGADRLPLSSMNMAGMGAKMIKGIMKKKNVDSLPQMIKHAQAAGVRMIACTMSMDLMGIKKEELIDNIDYAGVATYISKNENVGTTLFI